MSYASLARCSQGTEEKHLISFCICRTILHIRACITAAIVIVLSYRPWIRYYAQPCSTQDIYVLIITFIFIWPTDKYSIFSNCQSHGSKRHGY